MLQTVEEVKQRESSLSVLSEMMKMDHEEILFCQDKDTGLKAIIAIHNTILGPSLGGTRMWRYVSEEEALKDVMRLSRGMTYKSALAGLNLGGGKAVIIGDSKKDKSEALFRRFGKFVDSLSGRYITAEDVGISTKDIEYVSMETDHVAGLPESMGGGGDPSPITAYGVFVGIKAGLKHAYGKDDLNGIRVAVQGVGHVGEHLVEYLTEEGAKVIITDIHDDLIQHVVKKYNCSAVSSHEIYDVDMDVYAPCALGATVNKPNVDRMNCRVIAGAANNQLENEKKDGQYLLQKGIVYLPDYLINSGGIINCFSELTDHIYNREAALTRTENIYNTALEILKTADRENKPAQEVANKLAEERLRKIAQLNKTY